MRCVSYADLVQVIPDNRLALLGLEVIAAGPPRGQAVQFP
jgi:hypothetical protein